MTIVHIVEPFASGVAVFVRSLTEAMPDDLHIIVHGERKSEMSASEVKKNFPRENVRFIKWRSAGRSIHLFKDVMAVTELYKILKRLRQKKMVDAVHLHSSKSGLLGRIACRLTGISNIFYTPNGASFLSASNGFSRFFYQLLEKVSHKLLGGNMICCSASELEQYQKIGIIGDYINNGINIKRNKRPVHIRKTDKFRIVTSGRIERQKNPALFNAIASYFEDLRQIEFIWVGDGQDKDQFTAKNIKVTGWLNANEVKEYVSSSDVYLSTSRYEGLSFAVLEAMVLKKAVLLSNCTGNIDIVKNGLNGDLFANTGEAVFKILQYYNNREMLDVMGSFSGEICKVEFDVKENFKSYRRFYTGSLPETVGKAMWSFG
ncbi:glycosyltransferase [Terrimonas alba]|uniref:glycosyltransferase n=1 Tax=Terrimonas alba TaxID=3349636 RepID=UPI0035F25222